MISLEEAEQMTGNEPGDIRIRQETASDYLASEAMIRDAFWNKYAPGSDEHYLVKLMRDHPSYIPELTRIAEVDGAVAGAVYYTRSSVVDGETRTEVITFGPLGVAPRYQKMGIGRQLLAETLAKAKELGFRAVIIFGDPAYYSRFGFTGCDRFNITTADGKNFDAFMAVELYDGALKGVSGEFMESSVFQAINDPSGLENYDSQFPRREKLVLPGQLGTGE